MPDIAYLSYLMEDLTGFIHIAALNAVATQAMYSLSLMIKTKQQMNTGEGLEQRR